MARQLATLADRTFDVVVVGGGIAGAFTALDAALRGLSVALVERRDFGAATSAHSMRIVHGGIRYLQHLDIVRLRESCRERSAFLRIAPHLVRPLPIVVPTQGHGMGGKEAFQIALWLNALLTPDRNRGLTDPDRRIPRGRILSRAELLRRFPEFDDSHLNGAALFYDGHIHHAPRLVLAILRTASAHGAVVANYCEVRGFLGDRSRVEGVTIEDVLSGTRLEVRGRVVVNAAGPYAEELLVRAGLAPKRDTPLSRDMALVITRPLLRDSALAVQTRYRDPDAIFSRGNRHLFLVPWRDCTLIGVNSRTWEEHPSELAVSEAEVAGFVDEINEAWPAARLRLGDVGQVYAGLLPFGENDPGATDLSFGKRSLVVDHAAHGGPMGLLSAMSVRLTMGRSVAQHAVDLAFRKLGHVPPSCRTRETPVYGGQIAGFEAHRSELLRARPFDLPAGVLEELARNHGSASGEVLHWVQQEPKLGEPLGGSDVIGAEVRHAVCHELAQKLEDVVRRRTNLGAGGPPSRGALAACASLLASELDWDRERMEREIAEVQAGYPAWSRDADQ